MGLALEAVGVDLDFADWTFEDVDREFEMLFTEKLTGSEAQVVAESAGDSGFEIYRRLALEFAPTNSNTPGLLMANLTAMTRMQAKDPKDLKTKLRELDSRNRLYRERVGSSPEPTGCINVGQQSGPCDPPGHAPTGSEPDICRHAAANFGHPI